MSQPSAFGLTALYHFSHGYSIGTPFSADNVALILVVQSPKIIMTGLKLIPLTLTFEIDPWGQLYDVLLYIGMLQA